MDLRFEARSQYGNVRVFPEGALAPAVCALTGRKTIEPRDVAAPTGDDWFADADLPVARLELSAAAGWVVERYPTRSVEPVDGGTVVELTVTDPAWLGELLLRAGTAARVVSPDEWRHLGADAAASLLARYEADGNDAS